MSLKGNVFNFATNTLIKSLGLNRASAAWCKFIQRIDPIFLQETRTGEKIIISCPNEVTRIRAKTYFDKEPETIDWIDTFHPGETLIDIGANIGLYTLYAAKRGVRVFAFEPESQNYALLNRNIFLNGLSDRVMALNIAIAEKDRLDFLYLQQFQTGTAFNNFGAARDSEDHEFFPAYKQSVMAFSLDSFLVHHPECFPSHMKIDVDGNEAKVIDGAKATLMNPRLKSLLIELNEKLPEHVEMAKTIEAFGLKLKKKSRSGTAAMRNSLIVRNYIFEKDEGK